MPAARTYPATYPPASEADRRKEQIETTLAEWREWIFQSTD
jgi:hypothetical protein